MRYLAALTAAAARKKVNFELDTVAQAPVCRQLQDGET